MESVENNAVDVENHGTACIKAEYLFHCESIVETKSENEPGSERIKCIEKIKRGLGQNIGRYNWEKASEVEGLQFCKSLINVKEGEDFPTCLLPSCVFMHNVQDYLQSKDADLGKECYVFQTKGWCPRGITCRFGSGHITEDGKNKVAEKASVANLTKHLFIPIELQDMLKQKQYNFEKANKIVDESIEEQKKHMTKKDGDSFPAATEDVAQGSIEKDFEEGCSITDRPNVREKKTIDWKGKLYLAPLTSVGNLPFRRVCKEWGADVTVGEMVMAVPILQGAAHEWKLLRRHDTEDLFGVQICGSGTRVLSQCAQLIEETVNIDFIELNLSCPLKFVCEHGSGSRLLGRENLPSIIRSLSKVTTKPFTVKTRTGVFNHQTVALSQMPIYRAAGVSLITVHGRTREQRYNGNADWKYIEKCAVRASPTPVFGSGDILSYQHYNKVISSFPHVAGVMIGRGALYKPWIFTEIKEQREWDISSTERLDILKKFVNYGFEHWGTDTIGIETTRRFLLEWLSFLHRYIPVGLLERPPQNMNERPPRYVGRNDLETLMASPNCADWVKISEMLCGPVPEGFQFIPKHKDHAWSSE